MKDKLVQLYFFLVPFVLMSQEHNILECSGLLVKHWPSAGFNTSSRQAHSKDVH